MVNKSNVKDMNNSNIFKSKALLSLLQEIKTGRKEGSILYYTLTQRYDIKEDKNYTITSVLRSPINISIFEDRTLYDVIQMFIDIQIDIKATYFKII